MSSSLRQGMMKSAIALAIAAASWSAMPTDAQAQGGSARYQVRDQASRSLRGVAEAGLRQMVFEMGRGLSANGKLPADFPIGVSSHAELRQVTLGFGFEVNTIDPAALLYAGKNADLGRITHGTGVWNFVVLSKGQPVALLEVGQQNGRWQVLGAGATQLARDVHAAAQGNARDGAFRFVRVYQATADLMEVRGADNSTRYVPLVAARQSLRVGRSSTGALPSSQDLLPALQGAVRANLSRAQR